MNMNQDEFETSKYNTYNPQSVVCVIFSGISAYAKGAKHSQKYNYAHYQNYSPRVEIFCQLSLTTSFEGDLS